MRSNPSFTVTPTPPAPPPLGTQYVMTEEDPDSPGTGIATRYQLTEEGWVVVHVGPYRWIGDDLPPWQKEVHP